MLIYRTYNATSRNSPQNQIASFKKPIQQRTVFVFLPEPLKYLVVVFWILVKFYVTLYLMHHLCVNSSGASLGVETVQLLMVDDGCSTWDKWGNNSHVSQSHSSPRTNKNECINDLPGYSGKLLNG